MPSFFLIFSFILGTLIGSFLNVVALRFNTGMTLKGRSKCFSCGNSLSWYELIPIFSFIFQKGSCRKCKSKISWQYPLVEIISGLIFLMIFIVFPPISFETSITTVFYLLITCILLIITIYDIKHKVIPTVLSYTFCILAFIHLFFTPDLHFIIPSLWLQILAGPLIALPFFLLVIFSKETLMGMGDPILMLGIGWILGLSDGINAIIFAFWIAAIISVIWVYIIFRKMKFRYQIPFGPYLILGMYIVLLFSIRVIELPL